MSERLLWIPRLLVAAVFAATLPAKFTGAPDDVALFAMALVGTASGAVIAWMRRRRLPVIGRRFA